MVWVGLGWALGGCAAVGHVTQLDDNWYHVLHVGGDDSLARAVAKHNVFVQQHGDTLVFTPPATTEAARPVSWYYRLQPEHHVLLLKRHFDVDVFTLPFKVRPPRAGVPVQLNTNFNAALYVGQRLDFYYLNSRRATPWRQAPRIRATGLGYGLFLGLGSADISEYVTQQQNTFEYEGMVLHAGAATIYDALNFNVGLAVGFDHLLGADGRYWVYQHRPWFGVLFGLDLN
ncbi:hypothetical protein [Hymenobacter sp. BT491]|uniref:hypothetical protein n=1 Tax=Hymenobacter sp. BT491 TaxID=2766779 RepID=UPI0016536BF8|nr:hypothetical protein [Hymenobacter sp. BT491]MBC6991517.1 hypothetical protein [Hymenobacter sp. BT491]